MRLRYRVTRVALAGTAVLAASVLGLSAMSGGVAATASVPAVTAAKTPIQHLVVIFQENVSFDHYFGTYPDADRTTSAQPFTAAGRRSPSTG